MTTFKVLRHEPPTVQLEAETQYPGREVAATIFTSDPVDTEALQLELELFPVQEGEQFKFDAGSSIRLIPIQAKGVGVCPMPSSNPGRSDAKSNLKFREVD